jgi:hypothetical protein
MVELDPHSLEAAPVLEDREPRFFKYDPHNGSDFWQSLNSDGRWVPACDPWKLLPLLEARRSSRDAAEVAEAIRQFNSKHNLRDAA